MNTGKQINAMVLVLFLLVIASGVYILWDETRAENAETDQLEMTAERGAETFALNCRLCHGDRGEGGPLGGRLPGALPLNTDELSGVEDGVYTQEALDKAFDLVSNTIACGRIGTAMPTWAQVQGGTLNGEQIRQLAVLITGGDPILKVNEEEGFWDLAQEHADELDAAAALHAEVKQSDGMFSASAGELEVSNAAAFTTGQYIRIEDERLRIETLLLEVERGVDGSEAVEHETGTAIIKSDLAGQEEPATGDTLTEEVDAEQTELPVSGTKRVRPGETLTIDDEDVRVVRILTGIPTTKRLLVKSIGREPRELLVSGSEDIEVGATIRLAGESFAVKAIRDDGDAGLELDGELSSSANRISVSDADFFQPDYVVNVGSERIRVIGQVETGVRLGEPLGRAETTFTVSGTVGLSEGMVIRVGQELIEIIELQPARVTVERAVPDVEGNETQPASHSSGAAVRKTGAAGGEETGQTLLEPAGLDDDTFVISGTSGINEGDVYQLGDELVEVAEGGVEAARLRVRRAVDGSSLAEHSSRVPVFEGNLLDVERGVEGTSAASHDGGETIFLTELEVTREVDGTKVEDHAKGSEIFLGQRLLVERGAFDTEAADHENGLLVRAFPEAPDGDRNQGPACGIREIGVAPPQPTDTPIDPDAPTATPAEELAVSLVEFDVLPESGSVVAGQFDFLVTNDGVALHNLRVIRTDLAADDLPLSGPGVDEAAAELELVAGSADISSGGTESLSVELAPGSYVLICNVPGHYLSGMQVGFEVTEP